MSLGGVPGNSPWTFLPATDVPLAPGSSAEVTVTIVAGVAVEGRVTSSLDDSPIPQVLVSGSRTRGPGASGVALGAVTDAGVYRLRLGAGDTFEYSATVLPASGRTTSGPAGPSGVVTIPDGVASYSLPAIRLAPPAAKP